MAEETCKTTLGATRIGDRKYVATNERGGKLIMGYEPGEFSPGDLLKLAILGCNLLSGEARFDAALGKNTPLAGTIDAAYDAESNRFTDFLVKIDAELDSLSEDERTLLLSRVKKAIDRRCTISHTVEQSAPTNQEVNGLAL